MNTAGRGAPLRSFGRKQGHRLSGPRLELLETVLPGLAVRLPAGEPAGALDPKALFDVRVADVWLEIGFGAGHHLADQAQRHPAIGFIGAEPFVNGVAALVARTSQAGLRNVRVFQDDVRPLLAHVAEASLGRVFVLFPDPWPKARHHKRRLISRDTLDLLARVMADGAELRFASDHAEYAGWALARAIAHPAFMWTAERASDWRTRPEGSIETRYEAKARAAGRQPFFFTFRRLARGTERTPAGQN